MKQCKKLIANLLLVLIFFNLFATYCMADESSNDIIYINNIQELMAFTEDCSLDTYSHGKTVKLTQDINLSGYDFTPIPTFGGTFDGCGYTIENLTVTGTGSTQGFFRYVQKIGIVKNLKVTGTITPDGTKKNIGGMVGNNNGRILNCNFTGTIIAKTNVGGIAGINDANGYIDNCTVSGTITGETSSGGITGQNHGIVINCTNKSYVNTSSSDIVFQIQDMKLDQLNLMGTPISHTDTGGIAGYSDGILQSCNNIGKIGYQHIGYNVGGIVGRQAGYINNCTNSGEVLGRKEVSGIVGQMEPYLMIKFSEDTLRKLEKELGTLKTLLDKSVNDVDASSQNVSLHFSDLNILTGQASDEVHEVLTQTTAFTDETFTVVNDISLRLSRMLKRMEPIISSLGDTSKDITTAFDQFSDAFSELESSSTYLTAGIKELKNAFGNLSSAAKKIEKSIDKIDDAVIRIRYYLGDPEKMKLAMKELDTGFKELQEISNNMGETVNTISNILRKLNNPKAADLAGIDWNKVSDYLDTHSKPTLEKLNLSFSKFRSSFTILSEVAKKDIETIKEALTDLAESLDYLEDGVSFIEVATTDFQKAMTEFESGSETATKAMDKIEQGMSTLSSASKHMTSAMEELGQVVKDANNEPDIKFPMLSSKVTEPTNNLFATLDNISTELAELNTDSSHSSDTITKDVRAINNQIAKIINIIIKARRRAMEEDSDYYKDISESDSTTEKSNKRKKSHSNSSDVRKGYVTECFNEGSITGDIDVGGIVGSIAVEYDFDPEDDININGKTSLNFQYQTRAVLRDSINKGLVTSKKNYAGGMVGRMDLGLIAGCENYGDIESTDGDYVGGISGYSSTKIKNSYTKCNLSGNNYIGGITGQGTKVSDCYTLVKILKANENVGSIAGSSEGEFVNNYFVKDNWAGIDNISYTGKAVPQDYETFIQTEGLPNEFKQFSLTFKADDTVLKTMAFNYGDHIAEDDLPAIPLKDGHYSFWPEFNYDYLTFSETLEAVYTPLVTAITVEDSDNSKLPRLLAEGTFGPEAVVTLKNTDSFSFKPKENQKVLEQWTVTITEAKKELKPPFTFRYHFPTWNKKMRLWCLEESSWLPVDTKMDGSYIVFDAPDNTATFCIVEISDNMSYIAFSIAGLLIVMILIFIKKRKNKQTAKSEALNS